MTQQYDVVIIGGGPAGYAAALYGAAAGLNIAMIEKAKVGGTCLQVGCIPAKELLETAAVARTVAHSSVFGIESEVKGLDWSTTLQRKQGIVDQLTKGLSGLLAGRKVTVFDGVGTIGPDHRTVTITGGASDGTQILGQKVILAAGSVPRLIDGFPVDSESIVTSDELLSIPKLPMSAVVIGGGAIGCEFASMMSDLGTEVTVLEYAPKILPGCDIDAVKVVEKSFKNRGITIQTGVEVKSQETTAEGVTLSYGDDQKITVDTVVLSIGRRPASDTLGLQSTNIEVDGRGFIVVDDMCRTTVEGVWAIGDVISTPALAHVGFAEAMLAIKDILGESPAPVDYEKVPWCIYCFPEVAFVGHSEESAKEAGYDVVVSKHSFMGNGRAMIVGETDGLVKVIAEKDADGQAGKILGVHMAGPWVTEQLGQGYFAVNWEATVAEVAELIQPHPTMSELFGETVLSMTGRGLHG